ncbi:MAG TPA: diguanylate cyclase, partial [Acidimicrobiales bacterium]
MPTNQAALSETTLNRVFADAPQLVCVFDECGDLKLVRGRNGAVEPTSAVDLVVGREQVAAACRGESTSAVVERDERVYEVWAEPLGDGAMAVVTDLTDARRVEHRWRALVRDSGQMLAVVGADGGLEYASPALKRLVGWPSSGARVEVKDVFAVVHPDDLVAMRRDVARMLAGGTRRAAWNARVVAVDGGWRHLEVSATNLLDDVAMRGLVMNVRDVTEQRLADAELRRRARQQEVVAVLGHRALMGIDLAVLMTDAVAMVADTVGADLCSLLELDVEGRQLLVRAGVGWSPGVVGSTRLSVDADTAAGYALVSGGPVVIDNLAREVRFRGTELLRGHGVVSSALVAIQGVDRAFGVLAVHSRERRNFGSDDLHFLEAVANVLATAVERLQAEDEIRLQSVHDALTKLPNRTLFLDRLEQALARAARTGHTVAVLFLDLDRFKVVNDGLGHMAGDRLLVEVADRLRSIVRPGDTVARFGGDEFVVLCDDIGNEAGAVEVADRIGLVLAHPFLLSGREVMAGASVGIALAQGSEHEGAEALLRDADAAMYRAKERGKGRHEVFDEVIRARAVGRLETEHALRRAIGLGELRLLFQPG